MAIYVTGDCNGEFDKIKLLCFVKATDYNSGGK